MMRSSLAALSLVALCGCGTEKLEHPGDPVPPEQQGECGPTATSGELPSRATFRAGELEPLFDAERRVTLHWAGWTGLEDGEATLDVAIELDAEAVAARPGCVAYVELPATLTLASSDGLLALATPATVATNDPRRAALSVDLAHADLASVHERLADRMNQTADDSYPLELRLQDDTVEGALRVQALAGAAACDVASWPEPRRCPLGVTELPLDEAVPGLDASALVAELSSAQNLAPDWTEGEALLSLEVELDGASYCLEEDVPDESGKPSDRARIGLPLRVHATTADQQLDVWLPARLTLELDPDGTQRERSLRAHALAPSDATAVFGIAAPELAVVELRLEMGESGPQGSLSVRRLTPVAPELAPQDITPACLSTDLLGAFEDVAHGTW